MKICDHCKEEKGLDQFHKNKAQRDGFSGACKDCRSSARRGDRHTLDFARNYRNKHLNKYREYNKEYRTSHKEYFSEYNKRWYLRNLEYRREYNTLWGRTNKSKRRVIAHRRRSMVHGLPGEFNNKQWEDLCEYYQRRCVRCGQRRDLAVDHIIPVTWENSSNDISNIQPLCKSCNSAKRNFHKINYLELLWLFEGISIFKPLVQE